MTTIIILSALSLLFLAFAIGIAVKCVNDPREKCQALTTCVLLCITCACGAGHLYQRSLPAPTPDNKRNSFNQLP